MKTEKNGIIGIDMFPPDRPSKKLGYVIPLHVLHREGAAE
jgi:hypothetical protein